MMKTIKQTCDHLNYNKAIADLREICKHLENIREHHEIAGHELNDAYSTTRLMLLTLVAEKETSLKPKNKKGNLMKTIKQTCDHLHATIYVGRVVVDPPGNDVYWDSGTGIIHGDFESLYILAANNEEDLDEQKDYRACARILAGEVNKSQCGFRDVALALTDKVRNHDTEIPNAEELERLIAKWNGEEDDRT